MEKEKGKEIECGTILPSGAIYLCDPCLAETCARNSCGHIYNAIMEAIEENSCEHVQNHHVIEVLEKVKLYFSNLEAFSIILQYFEDNTNVKFKDDD